MDNISGDLLQIGAVAIIFLFCIKEFFSYLKQKRNSLPSNGTSKDILKELQLMNTNHLNTICVKIEEGNKELINTIHSDNIRIIELLGEIKGALSNRR